MRKMYHKSDVEYSQSSRIYSCEIKELKIANQTRERARKNYVLKRFMKTVTKTCTEEFIFCVNPDRVITYRYYYFRSLETFVQWH